MKYQIINKKTNKAVNLNALDKIYCQFTGEQVDELIYNNWYSAINGAIEIYADLSEHADEELRLYRRIVDQPRTMSMHQLVQCMTIAAAQYFYENEGYNDWKEYVDIIDPVAKLFLSLENKYFIKFI